MEHRRPSLIGPLILITIGVLLLLANLGYLPFSFWEIAARFWPLILVLIGVEILFGRRSWIGAIVILVVWVALIAGVLWLAFTQGAGVLPARASMTEQITQSLGDIQSATVDLDVGASTVFVTALNSDTANLMEGKFSHNENTRIVKTYSNGRLALKEQGAYSGFPAISTSRWDVAFYPQIP